MHRTHHAAVARLFAGQARLRPVIASMAILGNRGSFAGGHIQFVTKIAMQTAVLNAGNRCCIAVDAA